MQYDSVIDYLQSLGAFGFYFSMIALFLIAVFFVPRSIFVSIVVSYARLIGNLHNKSKNKLMSIVAFFGWLILYFFRFLLVVPEEIQGDNWLWRRWAKVRYKKNIRCNTEN